MSPDALDGNTHEVALLGGGWSAAIGYGLLRSHTIGLRIAEITWNRLELDEFVFSQPAAILVAQGKPVQDLFPPDVHFEMRADGQVISYGPFFFLKGVLSKPTDPPPRLRDVVLARVLFAPASIPMETVRGKLLEQVL